MWAAFGQWRRLRSKRRPRATRRGQAHAMSWKSSAKRFGRALGSAGARREIGGECRKIGLADLRLAERRHHRDARADERLRDRRHEIGALLERCRLAALVERL